MLNSVAEFYEEDVQNALATAMSLIEPVIMIIMGVVVAFVLISIEEVISLDPVSAALRSANGVKRVALQRETETILLYTRQAFRGVFSDR